MILKIQRIDSGGRQNLMESCKGFKDWLECLNCPYLCTTACPLEGENVVEKMRQQIHILSVNGTAKDNTAIN